MSLSTRAVIRAPGARAAPPPRASPTGTRVPARVARVATRVAPADGGVAETTDGTYKAAATAALNNCVTSSDLKYGQKYEGKVRDTYVDDDVMIAVTTDRQSAFDRHLASIPFKGAVLNRTSAWWFEQTKDIVPNAWLSSPDPNVTVMKKCTVFPIEFVVRGYLTGSTSTSLWTHYKSGGRDYCGNALDDGMVKNQQLPMNIVTPTTKEKTHDRPISLEDIVKEGWMEQEDLDYCAAKTLEVIYLSYFSYFRTCTGNLSDGRRVLCRQVFEFGQKVAAKRGLILVDTKYEFGRDADGTIRLIDEINTPDSSRYWLKDSYAARHAAGQEPDMIDKEFLRLWFAERYVIYILLTYGQLS